MAKNEAKKIMVGLGNPGKEYEHTYHNVGQLALNGLVADWERHKHIFEYAVLGDMVFIKPLTFMNESGKAVREALKKFNAKPKDLIVVHDDSDITVGNYKISFARNSAGHKGVQSVIDVLNTNEFTRARIGIRPEHEARRQKAGEFALKQITKKDQKTFDQLFQFLYTKVTEKE
jgi:PTH1 family peptidyl-tRNA hydrolase